jgi:hypothetical protein
MSAGDDGSVFLFAVSTLDAMNNVVETGLTDPLRAFRAFMVDDELGDILLMQKSSIEACINEVK